MLLFSRSQSRMHASATATKPRRGAHVGKAHEGSGHHNAEWWLGKGWKEEGFVETQCYFYRLPKFSIMCYKSL